MPKVGVEDGLEASAAARWAWPPHILLQPALHDAVAVQHQLNALQRCSGSSGGQRVAESVSCLAAAEGRELAVQGAAAVPQRQLKALEANSMGMTVCLEENSSCMAVQGGENQLSLCCPPTPAPAEGPSSRRAWVRVCGSCMGVQGAEHWLPIVLMPQASSSHAPNAESMAA